jgi:hypothetical protein
MQAKLVVVWKIAQEYDDLKKCREKRRRKKRQNEIDQEQRNSLQESVILNMIC